MHPDDQLNLIHDMLLCIAPAVARHALDKLSLTTGNPYSDQPIAGFEEARHKVFDQYAQYAIELASRLSGKFAQLSDAASGPTQAQNTPAVGLQSPAHTAAQIQRPTS